MMRRCARWMWFLLVSACLPRAAQASVPDIDVVHVGDPTKRDQVRSAITARSDLPVRPVDADPALLDALVWGSPDPGQAECRRIGATILQTRTWHPTVVPPHRIDELTVSLLEQASAELLDSRQDQTLRTLADAHRMLPCTGTILTPRQVRALYLNEALARFALKDRLYHDAFQQMLAVAPRAYLEPSYPPRIQGVFLEEVKRNLNTRMLPIDRAQVEAGFYIDGLPLEAVEELSPGTHIVQRRLPSGQVRTRAWTVPPPESGAVMEAIPLAERLDVGLPSRDAARARLAAGLRARHLEPDLEASLRWYLREHGSARLIFAIDPVAGDPSLLREFDAAAGVVAASSDGELIERVVPASSAPSAPPPAEGPTSRDTTRGSIQFAEGAGVFAQYLPDRAGNFTLNGRAAGYGLWIDASIHNVLLGFRFSSYPLLERPRASVAECADTGSQSLDTRIACRPDGAPLSVALGLSLRRRLLNRLDLVPGLFVQSMFLPDVLFESADGATTYITSSWTAGLSARARLDYALTSGAVRTTLGLELSGGAGYTTVSSADSSTSTGIIALPLSVGIGVGARL